MALRLAMNAHLAWVLVLVAGCTSPPEPDPTAPPAAEYPWGPCDFTYPDGSPVACDAQAPAAELVELGPANLCLLEFPDDEMTVRVLYSLTDSAYRIQLAGLKVPVEGLLIMDSPQDGTFFHWSQEPGDGRVVAFPNGGHERATLRVYNFTIQKDGAYKDWVVERKWSLYGDDPLVVHRLEGPEDVNYAMPIYTIHRQMFGHNSTDYRPADIIYKGPEGNLTTSYSMPVSGNFPLDYTQVNCVA